MEYEISDLLLHGCSSLILSFLVGIKKTIERIVLIFFQSIVIVSMRNQKNGAIHVIVSYQL